MDCYHYVVSTAPAAVNTLSVRSRQILRHMSSRNIQMSVTLEFEVAGRVRSYEFAISGDSFKEIKDRAKTLYEEISDTEYGGSVTEMPIRYHAET